MTTITFKYTFTNAKLERRYDKPEEKNIELCAQLSNTAVPEINKSLELDSDQYEIVLNSLEKYHLTAYIDYEYKVFVKKSIMLQPRQILCFGKPEHYWLDSGDYFAGELVGSTLTYAATCDIKVKGISTLRRGRTSIDKIIVLWDSIEIDHVSEIVVESVHQIHEHMLTK